MPTGTDGSLDLPDPNLKKDCDEIFLRLNLVAHKYFYCKQECFLSLGFFPVVYFPIRSYQLQKSKKTMTYHGDFTLSPE